MSVSGYLSMRDRIRETMRDTYGLLWSDDALDSLINEAQREYSLYSLTLTGEMPLVSTGGVSVYRTPPDFIKVIQIYDTSGGTIPVVSWKYLDNLYPDFRRATGKYCKALCFDLDGFQRFRFFPNLPNGLEVGKMIYARISGENHFETRNEDAIEAYCMFHVSLITGKRQASEYLKSFVSAVNREVRSHQTLENRRKNRRGVFY